MKKDWQTERRKKVNKKTTTKREWQERNKKSCSKANNFSRRRKSGGAAISTAISSGKILTFGNLRGGHVGEGRRFLSIFFHKLFLSSPFVYPFVLLLFFVSLLALTFFAYLSFLHSIETEYLIAFISKCVVKYINNNGTGHSLRLAKGCGRYSVHTFYLVYFHERS